MSIIKAANVHRQFKTADGILHVLKGVNLTVEPKEMLAITGASGVGKSTLLHIMGGLDRPTQGEVTLENTSLAGLSEERLARLRNKKVGFVFQFHYLLEDFTALENVMIPMFLAGHGQAEAAGRG